MPATSALDDGLPVVKLIQQTEPGDCGIAVLAMYLGMPYADVFAVAVTETHDPKVHLRGMWVRQIRQIALKLGVPLAIRRRWDMDTSCGIMNLEGTNAKYTEGHVVLLKAGLIFDTDGCVWEPETYFARSHFKAVSLMVRAG